MHNGNGNGDGTQRGLKVWFRDEIENALVAVDTANFDVASSVDSPEMRVYRKGYSAAIQAVAAAFGLSYSPKSLHSDEPRTVDANGWSHISR
jgi:hypothetical protein